MVPKYQEHFIFIIVQECTILVFLHSAVLTQRVSKFTSFFFKHKKNSHRKHCTHLLTS